MTVEVAEARLMLTASVEANVTLAQSTAVVDQFAGASQQQYLAPIQADLQSALGAFISQTAAVSSSVGLSQPATESSFGVFAGAMGSVSSNANSGSQQAIGFTQNSESQATGNLETPTTSAPSSSTTTSMFGQNANLSGFVATLPSATFGTFASGNGTRTTPSNSSNSDSSVNSGGSAGGTSSGSSSSFGTSAPSGAGSSSGSGTSPGSGSASGSGSSSGNSSQGSSTGSGSGTNGSTSNDGSSSGGDSNSSSSGTSSSGGWKPFELPEGVAFDEVHLPAEQYSANLRGLTPTGEVSFTNTTVTETSVGGTSTKLTVTLSQTYVDAQHWSVSQSWSKEYTIHESTGEKTGLWSESTRKGMSTFSITVSLGLGVPDRPSVGKKKPPVSDTGHSGESSAVPDPASSGLAPASSTPPPPPVVPVGPVSTVSFSTSDSLNNSVGDTHDGSDTTTGKVDKGNFAGSSNASASKSAALTEFDVLRPDGTLGHTIQLTAADDRSAGMKFKGGNQAFDAAGDVKDGNGNNTNGTSHPFGTPFASPGSKPPTNGNGFGNGTDPAPPMGGNGSRVESGAALNVSSSFSMGSYFSGEATTSVGTDLEEADITGTAGMHTDYDGSISASDSLSVDLQDSNATTGDFDYLSVGWSEGGSASRGLHFAYDMSLGDADLPTPPSTSSSSNSNPYPTDPSATSQVSSSGGSFGSASSSGSATSNNSTGTNSSGLAPTSTTSNLGASASGASSGSGTSSGSGSSGSAGNTPTPGKPLIELETLSNTGNGSKVWVQKRTNKTTGGPLPTTDTYTEKSALSVRISGGAAVSASTKVVNWEPTITVTAKGSMNVTFLDAFVDGHEWGLSHASPPHGYQYTVYQHQDMDQTSTTTHAAIDFNVSVTLSPIADPKMTGTVSIDVGSELKGVVGHYLHEKLVNLSNPSDVYEEWWLRQSVHREVLTAKGGVGGLANNLHIESFEQTYPIDVHTQNGTPPPPPPPQPTTTDKVLDYLQTGLDIAGMIPVIGEAADAINVGIHLGRGNYGEAALSLAAMIPLAGAGVTAGKFAHRAEKAIAHNIDKLDEVAAGAKKGFESVCNGPTCFVAGTQVVVAIMQDATRKTADEDPTVIVNEPEFERLSSENGTSPISLEAASESHVYSLAFVTAGLALAVIRHTWTSSPPPDAPTRRGRRRSRLFNSTITIDQ